MREGEGQTRSPCFWLETTVGLNAMGKTGEGVKGEGSQLTIRSLPTPTARAAEPLSNTGRKSRAELPGRRAATRFPPPAPPAPRVPRLPGSPGSMPGTARKLIHGAQGEGTGQQVRKVWWWNWLSSLCKLLGLI